MTKIGDKQFFNGLMLWSGSKSGISFTNRRVSHRVDTENLDAFFFAFHDDREVLDTIAKEFYSCGIKSEIIPLNKYTKGKKGFILETQRHPDFTEEHQKWYKDVGGWN